jgi:C4-dicarboxylate-specific signal transduction histidine kinase
MPNLKRAVAVSGRKKGSLPAGEFAIRESAGVRSPYGLVILIAVCVFISEASLMIVISLLPEIPTMVEALFDATLLMLVLSPILYFFVYRPFAQNIADLKRSEHAINEVNETLENRVKERTAELQSRTQQLYEQIKQMHCLYGVARLVEEHRESPEKIFRGTIDILLSAWQYPEITCGRIRLKDCEYKTENFKETEWKQATDIIAYGECVGSLEIFYLEKPPGIEERPFLNEGRDLFNTIALVLGRLIERAQTEEKLKRESQLNAALSELYEPLISPSASIEDIAYTVLEKAKSLTKSEHGFVSTIDPVTGNNVSHTLTEMLKNECTVISDKGIIFPRGADGRYPSLWGHALNTARPFFTNSAQNHQTATGTPSGHIPIERFLSVPVMMGKELAGQIALANKAMDYTDQDLVAIGRVAEFYALAIQRNRVGKALQKAKDELKERVNERTAELQQANDKLTAEIEERVRFEDQLGHSKSMLQAVVDGISDPLILMGRDMEVKLINRAAAEYYGVSDFMKIIGLPCHQALREKLAPCEGCEVAASLSDGKSFSFERRGFMDPERLEHVFVYALKGKDGRQEDVLLRINDVTEQRLFEKQLMQSEKMASLGVMVSSIAHEINNPNNFISFNIPILRDYIKELMPIVDDFAKKHPDLEIGNMPYIEFRKDISNLLDNIKHGSDRISDFVSNLKEFSQVKERIEKDWIDLNSVIEKVLSMCHVQLKKNVKTFIYNALKNPPPIWCDPFALEQILLNLLTNAALASDKKDSRVELRTQIRDNWLDHTILEVKDNGCGMDTASIQKIFDPFFTTQSDAGGTGLGLYVTHNLVESLKGRIEVESEPGKGSIFRVILPDKERRSRKRS